MPEFETNPCKCYFRVYSNRGKRVLGRGHVNIGICLLSASVFIQPRRKGGNNKDFFGKFCAFSLCIYTKLL